MRKINFIYAILDISMMQKLNVDPSSVRKNKFGNKFVYKTYKEQPLLVNVPLYTKKGIKGILDSSEWRNNLNIN